MHLHLQSIYPSKYTVYTSINHSKERTEEGIQLIPSSSLSPLLMWWRPAAAGLGSRWDLQSYLSILCTREVQALIPTLVYPCGMPIIMYGICCFNVSRNCMMHHACSVSLCSSYMQISKWISRFLNLILHCWYPGDWMV